MPNTKFNLEQVLLLLTATDIIETRYYLHQAYPNRISNDSLMLLLSQELSQHEQERYVSESTTSMAGLLYTAQSIVVPFQLHLNQI